MKNFLEFLKLSEDRDITNGSIEAQNWTNRKYLSKNSVSEKNLLEFIMENFPILTSLGRISCPKRNKPCICSTCGLFPIFPPI